MKKKRKMHLLGLGLDESEGMRRVTKADDYTLVGGSKDTHEQMQETAAKFSEEAKRRGKPVEQMEPKEFSEILEKLNGR